MTWDCQQCFKEFETDQGAANHHDSTGHDLEWTTETAKSAEESR